MDKFCPCFRFGEEKTSEDVIYLSKSKVYNDTRNSENSNSSSSLIEVIYDYIKIYKYFVIIYIPHPFLCVRKKELKLQIQTDIFSNAF